MCLFKHILIFSAFNVIHSVSSAAAVKCCAWFQGTVMDSSGKVNLPVQPLTFHRVAYPLMASVGWQVLKPPTLLALS